MHSASAPSTNMPRLPHRSFRIQNLSVDNPVDQVLKTVWVKPIPVTTEMNADRLIWEYVRLRA